MSNAVTALAGASYDGFVTVRDCGPRGMITLRGDLSAKPLQDAVSSLAGSAFPQPLQISGTTDAGIAWMSPDELLILCPYDAAPALCAQLTEALTGSHHLVVNVSDARTMIALTGGRCREALAKLSPADLSPQACPPATLRRTRLAQVPAAFWADEDDQFHVICFRSVARYTFDILSSAALPGSELDCF